MLTNTDLGKLLLFIHTFLGQDEHDDFIYETL
jgi:hypothetical protein